MNAVPYPNPMGALTEHQKDDARGGGGHGYGHEHEEEAEAAVCLEGNSEDDEACVGVRSS